MKKITLIITAFAILALTSCTKEELNNCDQAQKEFQQEIQRAENYESAKAVIERMQAKYPNCQF